MNCIIRLTISIWFFSLTPYSWYSPPRGRRGGPTLIMNPSMSVWRVSWWFFVLLPFLSVICNSTPNFQAFIVYMYTAYVHPPGILVKLSKVSIMFPIYLESVVLKYSGKPGYFHPTCMQLVFTYMRKLLVVVVRQVN